MTDQQFQKLYDRIMNELKATRLSAAQVSELVTLIRMRGEGR